MGIIPKSTIYGDDCIACFDADETPMYMKAFISGVKRGELWNPVLPMTPNGYWDLEQDLVDPCKWNALKPGWPEIIHGVGPRFNFFIFNYGVGIPVFHSIHGHGCRNKFENDFAGYWNNIYYGGHCFITTADWIRKQIESLTPMIDPNPRMECFTMEGDFIVVRYAGKRDATNISIKIDES